MRWFLLCVLFVSSTNLLGNDAPREGQTRLIGMMIKQALETYHSRNSKVDDKISAKAFNQYLKRIDPFKSFLLVSDVKRLEKYKLKMDDQMVNGDHKLLGLTTDIMRGRVTAADKLRKRYFKKNSFKFNTSEGIELDGDKKEYARNKKEFDENWRKLFKHMTMTRYLSLIEEGKDNGEVKEKAKKRGKRRAKKKEKKKTDSEMRKEAHDETSKFYARYFKRRLEQSGYDQLDTFFNSITTVYDPHTNYLPPRKKEDFDIDISGSIEGIGAVLEEVGPHIKVARVILGGAAWRQKGLEAGDIILMVGEGSKPPVNLVDMKVGDAVTYIRGRKGTEVRLTVQKIDGSKKIIPIVRDVVQNDVAFAKSSVLEDKKLNLRIGYIQLPKFYRDFGKNERNCTGDVSREISSLKKRNIDGIILDLRDNGGGALEDARQISGLFLKEGPIVQIKGHDGSVEVLRDDDKRIQYTGPLVVLINRFSASASEILAAAMQDYGRGVVVGGKYSHGKGTVQAVLNLNQGPLKSLLGGTMGALKVTIQKFYRIAGGSTQYKGITPDIILPDSKGYLSSREQDLDYSLPWDVIPAQKYMHWDHYSYNLSFLRKKSARRVRNSKAFKKIVESVKYSELQKGDTYASLDKGEVLKKRDKVKKVYDKLKLEYENKDLVISHFNPNVRLKAKMSPSDKKKWDKDIKEFRDTWIKDIKADPVLGESVLVMGDIVSSIKGKVAKR